MFVDIGLKFYAFTTHLSDLEVKVIDFDKFSGKAQVRRATQSCDSSYFIFSATPCFLFSCVTAKVFQSSIVEIFVINSLKLECFSK